MATCYSCGTVYADSRTSCPQCGSASAANDSLYNGSAWTEHDTSDKRSGYGTGSANYYNSHEGAGDYNSESGRGSYYKEYNNNHHTRYSAGFSPPDPTYVYSVPRERIVLGTGGFIGSIILMCIPVVGLIIQIIWACGGTTNLNRRNLARAYLLFSIIGIAMLIFIITVFGGTLIALFELMGTY